MNARAARLQGLLLGLVLAGIAALVVAVDLGRKEPPLAVVPAVVVETPLAEARAQVQKPTMPPLKVTAPRVAPTQQSLPTDTAAPVVYGPGPVPTAVITVPVAYPIVSSAPGVSASEVLTHAVQAELDPRPFGLQSYRATAVSPAGPDTSQSQIMFLAPAHKRVETNGRTFVFNEHGGWVYEPDTTLLFDFHEFGGALLTFPYPLRDAQARLLGSSMVAGRPVYVLDLTWTPAADTPREKAPASSAALVWFDAATYVPLKIEERDVTGAVLFLWEVTSFTPNPPLDASLFAFAPPLDASIDYHRPPTKEELDVIWQHIAGNVSYTLYQPKSVPSSFAVPSGPGISSNGTGWVTQSYYSAPAEDLKALTLVELPSGGSGPAPAKDSARQEQAVTVGPYSGQYVEQGNVRWLVLHANGTDIWVEESGSVDKQTMLQFASSLQPVAKSQTLAARPTVSPLQSRSLAGGFYMTFADPNHGWAYGTARDAPGRATSIIRATSDGGATWRTVGKLPDGLLGMQFTSAGEGWGYGKGIYKTEDGGVSWQKVGPKGDYSDVDPAFGTVWAWQQNCLPNPANMGAACETTPLISQDSGRTWQSAAPLLPKQGQAGGLFRLNAKDAWTHLLGPEKNGGPTSAGFMVTHDGGKHWNALPEAPCWDSDEFDRRSMAGKGSELWVLCGSQPGAGSQFKILYVSPDGGQTWELRSQSWRAGQDPGPDAISGGGYIHSFVVASPGHAWVSLQRNTLYGTSDGGRTWHEGIPMQGDGSVGDVVFVDADHGWFATIGSLFRTRDAGKSWEELPHP